MYLCTMKIKRIIKIIITVVVLLVLALWIKSRWHAWFSSPAETEFSYTAIPDRVTLTPGENFVSERTISWRCDTMLHESHLLLAVNGDTSIIKADGEEVISRGGKDIFYHAILSDLKPNTQYSYSVVTGSKQSQWYLINIPGAYNDRKIVYVGDVQDTIGGNSHNLYSKLYKEHADATFWAFGGDLIEAPIDRYWKYLYSCVDSTFANVPIVCATGNHEYLKTAYRTLDPRWTKNFVYPDNGANLAKGKSYYIKDDNILMIVFDTNGLQDVLSVSSEYQWLRKTLQEEGAGKWKIVMFHHPIYSVRAKRNNYLIRNTFEPLIEKYGVHLVLQGHEHGYASKISNKSGKNYPIYIISHASPKSYKAATHKDGMKIVPNRKMYQVIKISKERLQYNAFDLETDSILDNITITK